METCMLPAKSVCALICFYSWYMWCEHMCQEQHLHRPAKIDHGRIESLALQALKQCCESGMCAACILICTNACMRCILYALHADGIPDLHSMHFLGQQRKGSKSVMCKFYCDFVFLFSTYCVIDYEMYFVLCINIPTVYRVASSEIKYFTFSFYSMPVIMLSSI